jgi:hypothetical protein
MLDVEVPNRGKGVQRGVTDLGDGREASDLLLRMGYLSEYSGPKSGARRYRSATLAVQSSNCTCASSRSQSIGVQLMNWAESCAVKIGFIEESYIHVVRVEGRRCGSRVPLNIR